MAFRYFQSLKYNSLNFSSSEAIRSDRHFSKSSDLEFNLKSKIKILYDFI